MLEKRDVKKVIKCIIIQYAMLYFFFVKKTLKIKDRLESDSHRGLCEEIVMTIVLLTMPKKNSKLGYNVSIVIYLNG